MNRTTAKMVRGLFTNRVIPAAIAVGLDVTGWTLHEGTSYTGISWKLDMPGHQLHIGFGGNYLGMTAREAYDSLMNLCRAWEIVTEMRKAAPAKCDTCGTVTPVTAE